MFERLLSPRGFKIYMVCGIIMLGYVLWHRFANSGIVAWVDQLQVDYLWGFYSPEFSVLLLAIPIAILGFLIGLLHDFLTVQGAFPNRDEDNLTDGHSHREIEYQETTRKEFIDQVRSKHHTNLTTLKLLGFDELKFYSEIMPWFGLTRGLTDLFGVLGALASNEITAIGKNLSIKIFLLAMVSREHSTYASVFQLGSSFYTSFTDGTCIISSNYQGAEIQDDGHKIYKISRHRAIETTWAYHQQWVEKLVAEGKQITEHVSFADYAALNKRIDDYMLNHASKVKVAPNEYEPSFASSMVLAVFSAFIQVGIVAACSFFLIFLLNMVDRVYPQCWFVRNIHVDFPLLLLLLPGCLGSIATTWLLARIQHRFRNNLFAPNITVTRLLGQDSARNSEGYISTEWLALWIPLLPVRSYRITGEYTNPLNKETSYKMQPLSKIHWDQVKTTIRESWIGYAIFILAMLALPLWAVWECR